MSVLQLRTRQRQCGIVSLLILSAAALAAQSAGAPGTNPAPPVPVQTLEQRVDQLALKPWPLPAPGGWMMIA